MDPMVFSEERHLAYHRVVLSLLDDHPNLLARAARELDRMRGGHPNTGGVLDRWADLLDGPAEALAQALLADDPAGGLLRANSPFNGLFDDRERMTIWQRVALQQFAGFFLEAADDLDLAPADQATLTGLAADEIAAWRHDPPATMTLDTLSRLKAVVSIHQSLVGLRDERDGRRDWLDRPNDSLGARPIDLLRQGDVEVVRDYLAEAAQMVAGPDRMPVM
ncbi:MAG: DUF2384 domain-containing protein [Rhodobacterales bacterium]|nr:DUF2384 domain-containing protein [Rhodobacterales bacterium]